MLHAIGLGTLALIYLITLAAFFQRERADKKAVGVFVTAAWVSVVLARYMSGFELYAVYAVLDLAVVVALSNIEPLTRTNIVLVRISLVFMLSHVAGFAVYTAGWGPELYNLVIFLLYSLAFCYTGLKKVGIHEKDNVHGDWGINIFRNSHLRWGGNGSLFNR